MKNYKFYHLRELDARVGLAFNPKTSRFAIHFPSKGTSQRKGQPGKPRNPDRRALHTAIIEALDPCFDEKAPDLPCRLDVGIMALGKGGNLKQQLAYLHPSSILDCWRDSLPSTGNYAYTLYLSPSPVLTSGMFYTKGQPKDPKREALRACRILAACAGLVRFMPNFKHPTPVEVRWNVLKK